MRSQPRFISRLDGDFPSVIHQPASDAIIIICRQKRDLANPFFPNEVVDESWVLSDLGTDRSSTSRQARESAIHVGSGSYFKVPPLEVSGSKEFPHIEVGRLARRGKAAYCSHLRIFKGGEKVSDEGSPPEDIVIGKDGNGRLGFLEALDHLQALVGLLRSEKTDFVKFELVEDFLDSVDILLGCYDGDCRWIAGVDRFHTFHELFVFAQSRNDNGHVLGGQGGLARWKHRLAGPRRDDIADQSRVTPEPVPSACVSPWADHMAAGGLRTTGQGRGRCNASLDRT